MLTDYKVILDGEFWRSSGYGQGYASRDNVEEAIGNLQRKPREYYLFDSWSNFGRRILDTILPDEEGMQTCWGKLVFIPDEE